mmetsp:Transcript_24640/g.21864  ORF Transcript_24640/g.21864 Transcript_24640/m.21864 type:complete len:88 (+) Transcript_24640:177-440(+)
MGLRFTHEAYMNFSDIFRFSYGGGKIWLYRISGDLDDVVSLGVEMTSRFPSFTNVVLGSNGGATQTIYLRINGEIDQGIPLYGTKSN